MELNKSELVANILTLERVNRILEAEIDSLQKVVHAAREYVRDYRAGLYEEIGFCMLTQALKELESKGE